VQWTPHEIKKRRAAKGLDQTELGELLAEALGEDKPVSRRAITNWEQGHATPRGKYLHALDQVLGSEPSSDDVTLSRATYMQLLAELAKRYADATSGNVTTPDPNLGTWAWPSGGAPSTRRRTESDQENTPGVDFGH
jgi:transcriptional regulator with XRE-family HTH domain